MALLLILLFSMSAYTAAMPDQKNAVWKRSPEIGFWFYDSVVPHVKQVLIDCQHPASWKVACGFIPPQKFMLSGEAAYQLEQKEYKTLLKDFVLNPNHLSSVLRWQRFNHWVIQRATEAAYSSQFMITQHPELSSNLSSPLSHFARLALRPIEAKKHQAFFNRLAQSSALVYFSKSSCPYCRRQRPIIEDLSQKTGMPLWEASLDKNPTVTLIPARLLKVSRIPTLFLYLFPEEKRAGIWIRLATGLTDEKTVEDRMIMFVQAYRDALIAGIRSGSRAAPQPTFEKLYAHRLAVEAMQ